MYPYYINLCFGVCLVLQVINRSAGQNFWKISQVDTVYNKKQDKIIWCNINQYEQQKCNDFAQANRRDQIRVMYNTIEIECIQAGNKEECMKLLDEEKATMTTLDAGSVFIGGRYHSLVPIAQEVYEGGFKYYYSVAVVKAGTLQDISSIRDFREKKACFPGVETFAGWVIPINTLMKHGGMDIVDCNNHVKSATTFFGPSCAVNSLSDKYNPIGDNSDKLCQLCIGPIPGGRCTDHDPYAGYEGAFRCLMEAGEIAFLKHTTVKELITGMDFAQLSVDGFELICLDGSRKPISDYLSCNWGKVPSDTVVVSSAISADDRLKYQKFLQLFGERYGQHNGTFNQNSRGNQFYGNKVQPEYDQFGNVISNRFKRQSFGTTNTRTTYDNTDPYNPYSNQNQNQDRSKEKLSVVGYNNYDGNNQGDNYNRYTNDNNYNPYSNPNSNNNNDPYRKVENKNDPFAKDPFARDPYAINRDQYGVNIDPYDTEVKYHTGNEPLFGNNNTFDPNNRGGILQNNGTNVTYYEEFHLFQSIPRYGWHGNLMFQDATVGIFPLPESQQTYSNFLGTSLDTIMGVRDCPVAKMTLCVTSDAEKNKCVKMRTALKAQLLKPEMECYKGHSQIHCMQAIRAGTADVTVLDASDVYTAGLNYDLVPFISEVYNLEDPEYYVVAAAKESDHDTDLTYLKNKYTCHGGINTAAGWVYPLAFLISNGWIRPYGCNSIRAAAEYFTKSCVPGAISTEYNTGVPYDNMCDLCHGSSFRYCRRDASEDYYGHTGAFRCLVEGGGHVAFVKHTTVMENTGGKKREWWVRDNLNDDFELLCPDGTRAEVNEYRKCNLGKVKANAIVARGGYAYNETHINAYINLFMYAQTFYGRKTSDEFSFSMFYSVPPYSDLIFQDATTQLRVIEPDKREYSKYLGSDFMRARRIVDCHASAYKISASISTVVATLLWFLLLY